MLKYDGIDMTFADDMDSGLCKKWSKSERLQIMIDWYKYTGAILRDGKRLSIARKLEADKSRILDLLYGTRKDLTNGSI